MATNRAATCHRSQVCRTAAGKDCRFLVQNVGPFSSCNSSASLLLGPVKLIHAAFLSTLNDLDHSTLYTLPTGVEGVEGSERSQAQMVSPLHLGRCLGQER